LEEEVDETTFSISSHARRSLEIQEGWKTVRDGKRKRRREKVEDDDPASAEGLPVKADPRGPREGGNDEEGPSGGCAV
jgi:hypothetical protein